MLRKLAYYLFLKANVSPNTNAMVIDRINKLKGEIARDSELGNIFRGDHVNVREFKNYYYRNKDKYTEYVPNLRFFMPIIDYLTGKQYTGKYTVHVFREHGSTLLITPKKTITIVSLKDKKNNFFDNTYCYGLPFDRTMKLLASQALPVANMYTPQNLQEYLRYANIVQPIFVPHTTKSQVRTFIRDIVSTDGLYALESSRWFPMVGNLLGLSNSVVDYILTGIGTVAVKTALESTFLGKVKRTSVVMEAMDDEMEDPLADEQEEGDDTEETDNEDVKDESNDEEEPEDSDNEGSEGDSDTETNDSPESGDAMGDDGEEEEKEEEKNLLANIKTINSYKFKVDLINKETLPNLMWKFHLVNVVEEYKDNPPEHLSADTLSILYTWCNQWLFLVSIDTTKELLRQLKLNL